MKIKKLINTIILLLGVTVLYSQSWNQIGNAINGDVKWDQSGFKVCLSGDGTTVAFSAIQYDRDGFNSSDDAGMVRVYKNNNGTWEKIGQDIIGEQHNEDLGLSLSLNFDGTVLAVGTPQYLNVGEVKVFKYSNGNWVQIGTDLGGTKGTGYSLDLNSDGSVIVVGTRVYIYGLFNGVRVYKYDNPSESWKQVGKEINGGNDDLGFSVSINSKGNIIAMGGFDGYNLEGHVGVYQYIEDDGLWKIIEKPIEGKNAKDQSGWSVSLNSDGDIIAIGAPGNNDNGDYSGQTRIFKNISGTWTQLGSDINGDYHKHSGRSVSLNSDGSIVAVGSSVSDGYNKEKDHVSVYQFKDGTWKLLGEKIYESEAYSWFGDAISLSADGSTVAVGAFASDVNGEHSGQTRVYTYSGVLGMEELYATNINVYPNPAQNTLYLSYGKDAVSNSESFHIEIYSVTGQKVIVINHLTDNIDISELGKGIYLINFVTDRGTITRKFAVAR